MTTGQAKYSSYSSLQSLLCTKNASG